MNKFSFSDAHKSPSIHPPKSLSLAVNVIVVGTSSSFLSSHSKADAGVDLLNGLRNVYDL
jgi:hypothetical protein